MIPARHRGVELLDDPEADAALAIRSLRDVEQANRWFGGANAVLREVDIPLRIAQARRREVDQAQPLTLLDVGTGSGDIPERARRLAARRGLRLYTIGLERSVPLARAASARGGTVCVGDALQLPFPDRSIDIVTCSQVLHHFADTEARTLVRELHRVARQVVIIADLRRSWIAAAGIWLSSFALGFHPVSRHDGVLSVLRGYRRPELAALVASAIGLKPRTRHRLGFRVTAVWRTA